MITDRTATVLNPSISGLYFKSLNNNSCFGYGSRPALELAWGAVHKQYLGK